MKKLDMIFGIYLWKKMGTCVLDESSCLVERNRPGVAKDGKKKLGPLTEKYARFVDVVVFRICPPPPS